MASMSSETIQLLWDAINAEKEYKDSVFCPETPDMVPFPKQEAFLRDPSLTKLARCGNRAAKTFTSMRDLAWRVTRKHPYLPQWNCATDEEYMASPAKVWWVCAPDLTFINDVIWGQFLQQFIAQWYYTDDDLVPMAFTEKTKGKDFIQGLKLRNGDEIIFRSYTQSILSKMGASVKGGVYLDEPPPDLTVLTELVVRVLDGDGLFNMSFTPVDLDEDVIDYLEGHPALSTHRWSMMDNPVFRDNPDRLARAMAEFAHLPPHKRQLRIYGDYDTDAGEGKQFLFENLEPETVEDFAVPLHWRQVRVLDPAGHRSGLAIFAEDPSTIREDGTSDWFCITARHIEWKGRTVKATDIEGEVNRHAPYEEYTYFKSIYDNAESWFAAHAENKNGQWEPCILKKVELSITMMRNKIAEGRVKFFLNGAALAVKELKKAKRNIDTGKPMFKKLHALDCVRYFTMMIPEADPSIIPDKRNEEERMMHMATLQLQRQWASYGAEAKESIFQKQRRNRRTR
jgi:hypothetical protein